MLGQLFFIQNVGLTETSSSLIIMNVVAETNFFERRKIFLRLPSFSVNKIGNEIQFYKLIGFDQFQSRIRSLSENLLYLLDSLSISLDSSISPSPEINNLLSQIQLSFFTFCGFIFLNVIFKFSSFILPTGQYHSFFSFASQILLNSFID